MLWLTAAKDFISGIVSGLAGPLFGWLNKKEDTKVSEGVQDTDVIKARVGLLGQIHKDPAVAIGWYLFIVPTGLWYAGIVLYCFVHPWYPEWRVVLALPENIQYIPYAVVTFLFGLAWRGKL